MKEAYAVQGNILTHTHANTYIYTHSLTYTCTYISTRVHLNIGLR